MLRQTRRFPHRSTRGERLMLAGLWLLLIGSAVLYAWNLIAGLIAMLFVLGLFFAVNHIQKRRIAAEDLHGP